MDELVKRLRNEAECPDNYPEDSVLMREAADAIEELQKAVLRLEDESCILDELPLYQQPVGWIPVTERLPDRMMQCVCRYVFGDNEEYPFYQVLWYFTVEKTPHFQNEGSIGLRVTHWMPLPEKPKESEDE